ncbi:MAG: hypothetical protein JNL32_01605 [Candidatus Kapabacteria bacterium]|nr:hypothetical protein [Candidatus Kapabacteria bacterium]
MKTLCTVATAAALAILIASCNSNSVNVPPQQPAAADFLYSGKVGTVYTYDVHWKLVTKTFADSVQREMTLRVLATDTTDADGNRGMLLERRLPFISSPDSYATDTSWYYVKGNDVFVVTYGQLGNQSRTPARILRVPSAVGDSISPIDGAPKTVVASTNSSIVTPAGTFSAYQLQYARSGSTANNTTEEQSTIEHYSPKVNRVRVESNRITKENGVIVFHEQLIHVLKSIR